MATRCSFFAKNILRKIINILFAHRGLWSLLWVAGLLSVADIPTYAPAGCSIAYIAAYLLCVPAMKATLGTLLFGWLMKWRAGKICSWIFVAIYLLLSIVNGLSFFLYGMGITREWFILIGQTNPREAAEFLNGLLLAIRVVLSSWQSWIWLGLALVVPLVMWLVPDSGPVKRIWIIMALLLSMAGGVLAADFMWRNKWGRSSLFMTIRVPVMLGKYIQRLHYWDKFLGEHSSQIPDRKSLHVEGPDEMDFIMILGESSDPSHWHTYGYPLPTTPQVDALADSLRVFQNAMASFTTTCANMRRILSFVPEDQPDKDYPRYVFLMELMHHAGYHTDWISNQERDSKWMIGANALVADADRLWFSEDEVGRQDYDANEIVYDEVIIEKLRQYMKDEAPRRFFGLHMLGSHVNYDLRYPPARRKFTAKDIHAIRDLSDYHPVVARQISDYDNSILYSDSVIGRIIDIAAHSKRPTVVVYMSDHGENVFDTPGFGHRDMNHLRVPFLIYANPPYREAMPGILPLLDRAIQRRFSTANFVHMLMTLTGIRYSLYEPARDPLSDDFHPIAPIAPE